MGEWDKILPMLFAVIVGALSAYITVKVAVAELKKDIIHLRDKLNDEIENHVKMESANNENMKEVRNDVKAIFITLTKIQVDVAKGQGRDEVIETVKDAVLTVAKGK